VPHGGVDYAEREERDEVRVLIGGSTHGLQDARRVVDRLSGVHGRAGPAALFGDDRDVLVLRAPQVVTLGGTLGACAGGASLHWPLGTGVFVAVQSQEAPLLRVARLAPGLDRVTASLEVPFSHLTTREGPVSREVVRDYVNRHEDRRWAARTLGALLALMHERDHRAEEGLTVAIARAGAHPAAPGIDPAESVALLRALTLACRLPADADDLARLACASDARVLGPTAPLAGYVAAVRATPGDGLLVDAGPAPRAVTVFWPRDIRLTVLDIDTPPGPMPHAAACAAMRAAEALCAASVTSAALPTGPPGPGQPGPARADALLARCTAEQFHAEWRHHLPERLPGREVRAAAGTANRGTAAGACAEVDDVRTYPVRAIARLAVADADRVHTLRALLEGGGPHRDPQLAAVCAEGWAEHTALGLVPEVVAGAVRAATPVFAAAGGIGVLDAAPGGAPRLAVIERSADGAAAARLATAIGRAAECHVACRGGTSPGLLHFGTVRLRGR
jgi:hypothetical protein